MNERALVIDFDGTITEQDTLDELAQRFGDEDVFAEVEGALLGGDLPLHEVIRREFAPVKTPLPEAVDWVLANARLRPGFSELVHHARERGYDVTVVSSGFAELIRPVLDREGLGDLRLIASSIDPDPAGWRISFHDDEECPVCGQACKRASVQALANGGQVVYVGDGYSDRCAAELADRVFARAGLASYLDGRGVPYEPFEDFHDITRALS
jgi:2-hydroxy-3-keto-5-methylthiopentenyl-1-phosphate phosphatase